METYCGLFFCRPWESILMSSMCTTLLGCVSISPNVSPLCQPNTRQLSTIVFEISNKISISDVEFCQFKGGGGWDNPSFYHFFKKNFCQKVLWNFYSKFSKILSCRKFCLEISSLWLCKLDYFWFGFFLDSLFSIFHVMQVSVISSLFWFDSSFRLTLISAYSPSRCCSN